MRYIGNKENIIEKIYQILLSNGIKGESFFDFFSGTANVAKFFKSKQYKVFSNDIMYMSYCLQKAYIENNEEPQFDKLLEHINYTCSGTLFATPLETVVEYLNTIPPIKGFIYKNYTPGGTQDLAMPRMYFSSENGQIIDAIRTQIELWQDKELISEDEYYILLACLIESVSFYANVAGVYAAYQKKWDPRAVKRLVLRPIKLLGNSKRNVVSNVDGMSLINEIDVDILYLDPPYNERQYLPNYHLIETIARYDNPQIHGATGMRDYNGQKSSFCNARTALADLETIASTAKFKWLVMSYNSEGIMPQDDILSMLSKYGKTKLEQFEYARFKSNNNGEAKTKKTVFEQLYILEKCVSDNKNYGLQ